MSKHSLETADRPRSISAGDIVSWGMRTLLVPAGDRIRKLRRSLLAFLQPNVAATYKPTQMKTARNYVLDCLENSQGHLDHAKTYAASVVMAISYGKTTPTSYSDPEVQAVNCCLRRLGSALRPGTYLVDTYSFLRYIPGYLSHLLHRSKQGLSRIGYCSLTLAAGEAQPSFTTYLLDNQQTLGLSDNELAYLVGSMFGAGSDTTAPALDIVSMAAACYPEAQAKVQAQLDRVVGRSRLPTFEDQEMFTEVSAFLLETYRWRPVSSGGFTHRATTDIVWKNYVIPAGAEVIGCHWAISRDPDAYPEPEEFRPQRWLDAGGRFRDDIRFFNFGFGRRICPGQHVADNSLFIILRSLCGPSRSHRILQTPSTRTRLLRPSLAVA
ncbi:hypothetical protein AcV5_005691 [Taiwanofungus camphoratus]|nr:hypothetical protein AcV5_005691 [Antrodia cinnamomea]